MHRNPTLKQRVMELSLSKYSLLKHLIIRWKKGLTFVESAKIT
jgi:hypothetical protein